MSRREIEPSESGPRIVERALHAVGPHQTRLVTLPPGFAKANHVEGRGARVLAGSAGPFVIIAPTSESRRLFSLLGAIEEGTV
jgi:hypothetical protein